MKVKIYTNLDNELIRAWRNLWKKHLYANIVNSPEWFIAACESFGYRQKLIIAIYRQAKLIAIAGFVKSNLFGIPFFVTPGESFADSQPLLVDFTNRKITYTFVSELIKLGNVYIKSFSLKSANLLLRYQKNIRFFPGDIHPYVNFADGEYGSLSRENKNQIFNRIEKLNNVDIDIREDNHEELLNIASQIEIESSKMEKGICVMDKEDAKNFYYSLAKLLPGSVSTAVLFFNKKPAAYSIGFTHGNSFSSTQKAHIPEYDYYRPGKLIKIFLMDYWKKKHPGEEFGLGPGYDRFKMDFTKRTIRTYNIVLSKHSFITAYIIFAYNLHKNAYYLLSRNKKMYALYKKLIRIFNLNS